MDLTEFYLQEKNIIKDLGTYTEKCFAFHEFFDFSKYHAFILPIIHFKNLKIWMTIYGYVYYSPSPDHIEVELGGIQVLRHHDFDLFWSTHPPYHQMSSFPIPTIKMT